MIQNLSPRQRLERIAEIIERVDHRAMAADGPVAPTLKEMTQGEMSSIYKLASAPIASSQPSEVRETRATAKRIADFVANSVMCPEHGYSGPAAPIIDMVDLELKHLLDGVRAIDGRPEPNDADAEREMEIQLGQRPRDP